MQNQVSQSNIAKSKQLITAAKWMFKYKPNCLASRAYALLNLDQARILLNTRPATFAI